MGSRGVRGPEIEVHVYGDLLQRKVLNGKLKPMQDLRGKGISKILEQVSVGKDIP